MASIADRARELEGARARGQAVPQLTAAGPLSLEDAYRVQDEGVRLRVAAGDAIAGYKMGLTSKAKMKQMGVETPIMGVLLRSMRVASGATFPLKGLIHPRIEPEIAFILAKELSGPVSPEEALAACSGVCPALEILDSRYLNFKFTLPDVVADNGSGCAFVLGDPRPVKDVDVASLRMDLSLDGKIVQSGSSAEIYGHPAASLAELSRMLGAAGKRLEPGSVVLAGAATAAVALAGAKEVVLDVERLGRLSLRISA